MFLKVLDGPEGSVLVRVGILIASDEDGEEELAPENGGNFFDITAVPSEKFKKANKANTKKALES